MNFSEVDFKKMGSIFSLLSSTVGWAKALSAQHLIMDTSCDIEEQI